MSCIFGDKNCINKIVLKKSDYNCVCADAYSQITEIIISIDKNRLCVFNIDIENILTNEIYTDGFYKGFTIKKSDKYKFDEKTIDEINQYLFDTNDMIIYAERACFDAGKEALFLNLYTSKMRKINIDLYGSENPIIIKFHKDGTNFLRAYPAFFNVVVNRLGKGSASVAHRSCLNYISEENDFYHYHFTKYRENQSSHTLKQESSELITPNLCTIIQLGLYKIYDYPESITEYNYKVTKNDYVKTAFYIDVVKIHQTKNNNVQIVLHTNHKGNAYFINSINRFSENMKSDEHILDAFSIKNTDIVTVITNKGGIYIYRIGGKSTDPYMTPSYSISNIPAEISMEFIKKSLEKYNYLKTNARNDYITVFTDMVKEYNSYCGKRIEEEIESLKRSIKELENDVN